MPFIALAVLGASIYTANRQSAAASAARRDAQTQATQAASMAKSQLAEQRRQSQIAQERLGFEIGRAAEDRARVQEEAQRMAQQLEDEQRRFAEEEATRMQQMRRGGMRALLSQERLSPEMGLGSYEGGTFGAGVGLQ